MATSIISASKQRVNAGPGIGLDTRRRNLAPRDALAERIETYESVLAVLSEVTAELRAAARLAPVGIEQASAHLIAGDAHALGDRIRASLRRMTSEDAGEGRSNSRVAS